MTIIPSSAEKDIQRILKQLFPLATPQDWEKKWELLQRESKMTIVVDKESKKKSLEIKTENPEVRDLVNSLEIGQHLARLPDESVRAIAYTNALEWEWHRRRTRNDWVARFFIANRLCFDSKLFVDTAKTELGKWGYEIACAYADLLGKKWELIDAVHPHLKKFLSQLGVEYPFKFSPDLFLEIQRAHEKSRFENYALYYWDIDAPNWTEFWESVASGNFESTHEVIINLDLVKRPHEWFDVILMVSPSLADEKQDLRLQRRLNNYFNEIKQYAHVLAEAGKARTAEGKIAKSLTWIDGDLYVAGRRDTRYKLEL
jgi:hypothetical protein